MTARRGDASDAVIEILHRQLRAGPSDFDWNPICAGGDAEKTCRAANRALSADNIISNDHGVFRGPIESRYPKTANGDRS